MTLTPGEVARFSKYVSKTPSCWEWIGGKSDGYGTIRIQGKARKSHRMAFLIAHGAIQDGLFVCHKCDNPGCVNPDHLFEATHQVNMKDCSTKGRMHLGEKCANSKLTAGEVVEIRRESKAGATQRDLGKKYGVSQVTIFKIVNRRTWPHVP